MANGKKQLWCEVFVVVAALCCFSQAKAVPVDGVCTPAEVAAKECVTLGQHVLEIVPQDGEFPLTDQCTVGGSPVACAVWPYRFAGPSGDNQVTFLAPDPLIPQSFQDAAISGCQQLYHNGVGDPTGFGKNVATHDACRVAFNPDPGPGFPNIVIRTVLATSGAMSLQLKAGKSTFGGQILGPFSAGVPDIATTTETVTTTSGATLTVEANQVGDLVGATANTGPVTLVPLGQAVLCSKTTEETPDFPTGFPTGWDCDKIVWNNDGTNVHAGDNSTCYYRRSDGSLLKYSC